MTSFDGLGGTVAARVMATMNADMEQAAIDLAGPQSGDRVLVIGFGPGVGISALLDAVDPASVVGVDPSQAMHRSARRRLSRHPRRDRVRLIVGGAADVPGDLEADTAIAVNSHQLWEPHEESAGAVARALRRGGRLVTLTHAWAITKRAPLDEWRQMVESDLSGAGFEGIEWGSSSYRSGPAVVLRARAGGV